MSLKLLAVEGCQLGFSVPAYVGTILILPASVTSFKTACQGKKVYMAISFSVSGFTGGAIASGTGVGMIFGTAEKVKDLNVSPVRKDDSTDILITDSVSPYGTLTVTVKVANAGQTKAKAV